MTRVDADAQALATLFKEQGREATAAAFRRIVCEISHAEAVVLRERFHELVGATAPTKPPQHVS